MGQGQEALEVVLAAGRPQPGGPIRALRPGQRSWQALGAWSPSVHHKRGDGTAGGQTCIFAPRQRSEASLPRFSMPCLQRGCLLATGGASSQEQGDESTRRKLSQCLLRMSCGAGRWEAGAAGDAGLFLSHLTFHQGGAAEPAIDSSRENLLTTHQARTEPLFLPLHPHRSPRLWT